jgi:hypothetical protein
LQHPGENWSTGTAHRDRLLETGIMERAVTELLANRAGLDKALAEFPEDVAAAAEQASSAVVRMKAPQDPRAEPWPPMRAGAGL